MIRQELTTDYTDLRQIVRNARVMEEKLALSELMACENTSHKQRAQISLKTAKLIENLRQSRRPDLLSQFIAEYNLNTEEGLSLMTLAESFLRVTDNKTRDKLFVDKRSDNAWYQHLPIRRQRQVSIRARGQTADIECSR